MWRVASAAGVLYWLLANSLGAIIMKLSKVDSIKVLGGVYCSFKVAVKKVFSSPGSTFIVISFVFGLLTILLVPPFTGADEEAHFTRAYGITDGKFVLKPGEQIMMPVSYKMTLGCMQSKQPVAGQLHSYMYERYGERKLDAFKCAASLGGSVNATEAVPTTAAGYSPTTYIPQVIAISLGKILNLPIIAMDYLVRLAVLVSYIGLVWLAIRIAPAYKWALVGVALLPHSIFQITNPGADYLLFGAVAVFVAVIVRSMQLEGREYQKYSRKLLLVASIAAVLMILPKGIFPGLCFMPLLFFFGGIKKSLLIKIVLFVGICLIGFAWQKLATTTIIELPSEGARTLFSFPYAFLKTMFYGWVNTDFVYGYMGMGFDTKVGMPSIAITIMNMLLAVYLCVGYSKDKIMHWVSLFHKRLFVIVGVTAAVGVVVGSFAALYFAGSYLQDESGVIKGVQTRYFYPALFLLALLPFTRMVIVSERLFRKTVVIGSIFLLLAQTITIAVRYQWGVF